MALIFSNHAPNSVFVKIKSLERLTSLQFHHMGSSWTVTKLLSREMQFVLTEVTEQN